MERFCDPIKMEFNNLKLQCLNIVDISIKRKSNELIPLSDCLKYLSEEHSRDVTINVVVEEYDTEGLDLDEARLIKTATSAEQYKNGTIVILAQSIEKTRSTDVNGTEEIHHKSHCFEEAAFQVFTLEETKRYTRIIHDISSESKSRIGISKTAFIMPDFANRAHHHQEEPGSARSNNNRDRFREAIVPNILLNDEIPEASSSESHDLTEGIEDVVIIPTVDATAKFMPTESISNASRLKTRIGFNKACCKHGIKGGKAKLLRLDVDCHEEEILSHFMSRFLKNGDQSLLICNSFNHLQLISRSMQRCNIEFNDYCYSINGENRAPASKERRKVYGEWWDEGKILLTDNCGCRGLEAKKVINITLSFKKF